MVLDNADAITLQHMMEVIVYLQLHFSWGSGYFRYRREGAGLICRGLLGVHSRKGVEDEEVFKVRQPFAGTGYVLSRLRTGNSAQTGPEKGWRKALR
jgi:hypothetical protein